jgi:hypothetical protein
VEDTIAPFGNLYSIEHIAIVILGHRQACHLYVVRLWLQLQHRRRWVPCARPPIGQFESSILMRRLLIVAVALLVSSCGGS